MYRITALVLLVFIASAAHAAEDSDYISPEDRAVLDMFFCRHPHAELGKDGCVVMRPEDAQFRVPPCAPGYEEACQQRDRGTDGLRRVNPVTGK